MTDVLPALPTNVPPAGSQTRSNPGKVNGQGPAGGFIVNVTSTAVFVNANTKVFHRLTIKNPNTNSYTIFAGQEGNPSMDIPPGAAYTFFDVSPNRVYVTSPTATQTVAWVGDGNHFANESSRFNPE